MPKTINIITEENVPVEDWFKGNFEAHKVEGVADTYALVRVEKTTYATTDWKVYPSTTQLANMESTN